MEENAVMATVRATYVNVGDVVEYTDADGLLASGSVRRVDEIEIPGSTVYATTVEHADGQSSLVNWTDQTEVTLL